MKILQVNCVYNTGSTGKITYDIHQSLKKQGIESVVYYGRGKKCKEKNVSKVCGEAYAKMQNLRSRFTGLMYGGCTFSTDQIIKKIRMENPDVVHLQCINGYFVNIYRLIRWLKVQGIPTVLTLHAEFMYTANCGHAMECDRWLQGCGNCPNPKKATKSLFFDNTGKSFQKMQEAFEGFGKNLCVVSVSPWLMERAVQSPILRTMKHQVILNGVDTKIFSSQNTEGLREKHQLGQKKCILHVTAKFSDEPGHAKGGACVLELAERMKDRDAVFLIAGEHRISGKIPENMILLGKIQNQKLLAEYYSLADITLITSKRETFSMPCAESLCCGTPVLGFKAGGPEQIALPEYSEFVEYGNIETLEKCARTWLFEKEIPCNEISEKAKEKYSKEKMAGLYMELYRRMLDE